MLWIIKPFCKLLGFITKDELTQWIYFTWHHFILMQNWHVLFQICYIWPSTRNNLFYVRSIKMHIALFYGKPVVIFHWCKRIVFDIHSFVLLLAQCNEFVFSSGNQRQYKHIMGIFEKCIFIFSTYSYFLGHAMSPQVSPESRQFIRKILPKIVLINACDKLLSLINEYEWIVPSHTIHVTGLRRTNHLANTNAKSVGFAAVIILKDGRPLPLSILWERILLGLRRSSPW